MVNPRRKTRKCSEVGMDAMDTELFLAIYNRHEGSINKNRFPIVRTEFNPITEEDDIIEFGAWCRDIPDDEWDEPSQIFKYVLGEIAGYYNLDLSNFYQAHWAELYFCGYKAIISTDGFFAGAQWKIPFLSYEQLNEFAIDAQLGSETARELLCIYSGRMVKKVVYSFRWAWGQGLEMMDLYQAGMMGLIRSIETWDEEEGVDFLGWAKWRVYGEITNAITRDGPFVKLPRAWKLLQGKLPGYRRMLESELGGQATYGELAFWMFQHGKTDRLVPAQRIEFLETYYVSSTHAKVEDDDGHEVEVQDLYEGTVADPAELTATQELARLLLDCLTDEERVIVENAREGMGRMTFKEIAKEILPYSPITEKPLTSETVRNRFFNAIFKMKAAAAELEIDGDLALDRLAS